jgi:hypothetical protein
MTHAIMMFDGVDLSDAELVGWTSSALASDYVVFEGPEVKKSKGKFVIDFDFDDSVVSTFTFQFAEVLYDGVTETIQNTGNIEYDGSKLLKPTVNGLSVGQMANITAYFAPATAVPIPSSVVLMMSAIGFLGIVRRRNNAGAVAARS